MADLSDVPAAAAETVEKSCRGNRYCSFTGPFHPEHLAGTGRGRPHVVGRCYSFGCGAYVCDRCAHRRPLPGPDGQASGRLEMLCCPFDGEPLGRGDTWLVLSPEGRVRLPLTAERGGSKIMLLTRQHFIEIGQQYKVSEGEAATMFNVYESGFRETAPPHAPMEVNEGVLQTIHLIMVLVSAYKSGGISDEELARGLQKAFADRQKAAQPKRGFFARLFGR